MQNYKDLEENIQRLDTLLIDSLLQRGYLSIQRNTSIIGDVYITGEILEQATLYIEIVSVIRRFCYIHPVNIFEDPCSNTTIGGQVATSEQVQSEITSIANTSVSALLRTFYTPNKKGILDYLKADLKVYGFPKLDIQLINCTSSSQSEQFEIKALLSLLKWITIENSYIPTAINLHQGGKFREYNRGILRRAHSELEIYCKSTKCELVLSGFRHFLVSALHFKNSDVHMSEKYDLTNMYSHMQTISADIRRLMLSYMWSNTTSIVVPKACQLTQVAQEDLIDMKDHFIQHNFIRGLGVVIQDATLVNGVQEVLDCYSHDFLIEGIKVVDIYSLPTGYWVYLEDTYEIHSSIELCCDRSRLMCIGQENSNLLALETRGGEIDIVNDEGLKGDGSQRCLLKSKLRDIRKALDNLIGEADYALLLTSSIDGIEGSTLRFTPVSDNGNMTLELSYFK